MGYSPQLGFETARGENLREAGCRFWAQILNIGTLIKSPHPPCRAPSPIRSRTGEGKTIKDYRLLPARMGEGGRQARSRALCPDIQLHLKKARKKLDSNSRRTIDWPAIRVAYEAGDELVRDIASAHGVTESMIDRRRAKEAWPRRTDTGRLAPRPPKVDQVDWLAVQQDYEAGEYSLLKSPGAMAAASPAFSSKRTWGIGGAAPGISPGLWGGRHRDRAAPAQVRTHNKTWQCLQPGWALLKKSIPAIP